MSEFTASTQGISTPRLHGSFSHYSFVLVALVTASVTIKFWMNLGSPVDVMLDGKVKAFPSQAHAAHILHTLFSSENLSDWWVGNLCLKAMSGDSSVCIINISICLNSFWQQFCPSVFVNTWWQNLYMWIHMGKKIIIKLLTWE